MHGQCCSQVSRREQLGSKAKGEQARKEKGELRKQAAKAAPVGDSEEVEVEERVDEPEKKVQKSRKKAKGKAKRKGKKAVDDDDEDAVMSPAVVDLKYKMDVMKDAIEEAKAKPSRRSASSKAEAKKPKAKAKSGARAAKSQNVKPKANVGKDVGPVSEAEKMVPPNRRMFLGNVPATPTFARRYQPHGAGLSRSKWIAIRAAFYENLYQNLDAPSRHEDRPCV